MEGKKDNGNGNGKKDMIYEETNTENSSLHKEIQNNSQFSNLDLKEQMNSVFNRINQLTQDISDLQESNKMLNNENVIIKKRLRKTEKRLDALESLIIRNNINMDLLANRDSLKTILLMFSVSLNVTKIEEIKKMLKDYCCTKKFTKLVVDILGHLDKKLNPVIFIRSGFSSHTETLSQEEKEKIKNQLIFEECIHFIVCSIDNIVHPEEEEEKKTDIYSKLIGRRSKKKLQESLIQFFENPKTMEELSSLINNLKNKLIIGQGDKDGKEKENIMIKKEEDNKNVIINENVEPKKEEDNKNVINDKDGSVKSDENNPVKMAKENNDIKQENDINSKSENNTNMQMKEDANKEINEVDINPKKEEDVNKEKEENIKKEEDVNKEKEEKEKHSKKEEDSNKEKDEAKSNTNNKKGENNIAEKQHMKKNITKLLKEKEEIKNVKNANLEKEGKPAENGKMPEETKERKEKEKHLKIEKNKHTNEEPENGKESSKNNEMKEIKDSNKNQNEQNKNEIKEEEHSEVFNGQKEEKNFTY